MSPIRLKRSILGLAVAVVFAAAPAAQAEVTPENFRLATFGDFTALCGVSVDDPNATSAIHMCHGYIVGVTQFHRLFDRALEGSIYCITEEARPSRDIAIAMLLEWSKGHPQYAGEPPIEGVLIWAAETYPCAQ
jgi:hypothetical protein